MPFILLQDNTAPRSSGDSSWNSLVQQDGIHDDRHHLQKCWQGLWPDNNVQLHSGVIFKSGIPFWKLKQEWKKSAVKNQGLYGP